MKHCFCFLLMVATTTLCFAGDKETASTTSVYVRLVKVAHGPYEFATLFATFEPISLNSGFGGGARGGGGYGVQPPEAETAIGKPFTVEMLHAGLKRTAEAYAHNETMVNVIRSCVDVHKPETLKLHLVLSIPADAAKDVDGDRDLSQWTIQSVDTVH